MSVPKHVVLIPCWQRAEFLWHCLANITRAQRSSEFHYIFRVDYGYSVDVLDVIEDWANRTGFSHEVAITARSGYRLSKQSYSLLTGYALAAERTAGLVIMVEEDVMVRDDFFAWHLAVQEAEPHSFCSIAVANPNRVLQAGSGPEHAYYRSTGDYCSLGVCFRADTIRQHILPRATNDYYINPVDYCRSNFKGLPFGDAFAEQDGLIRRIEFSPTADTGPIVWPWKPRAYHAGLYGKNRGPGPAGNFGKRLDYVTSVIYSDEAMRTFAKHPEWYEDSRPIPLTAPAEAYAQPEHYPMNLHLNPLRA
jgi:hypothetical protein